MKVGILGGGQLARMLMLAGYPLGLDFIVLEPNAEPNATYLCEHLHGAYDDPNLLELLAKKADVVTYEFENIPFVVADYLANHTKIYPAVNALQNAQDRLIEKNFLRQLEIPIADFMPVDSLEALTTAMNSVSYPAILKSRRMGYDGKGQVLLKSSKDLTSAWQKMRDTPSIVEAFVPFQREVSIIAARRADGCCVFYPLSANTHNNGILHIAESCIADPLQKQAECLVTRLLNALDYVGVIALELFDVDGELLANEYAPRVHNSGHWTIEGAQTSQFENHLRAILNLPLGSTVIHGHAGMVNFIGNHPAPEQVMAIAGTHLHLYAKSPRKGRKVGHATIQTDQRKQYVTSLQQLLVLAKATADEH